MLKNFNCTFHLFPANRTSKNEIKKTFFLARWADGEMDINIYWFFLSPFRSSFHFEFDTLALHMIPFLDDLQTWSRKRDHKRLFIIQIKLSDCMKKHKNFFARYFHDLKQNYLTKIAWSNFLQLPLRCRIVFETLKFIDKHFFTQFFWIIFWEKKEPENLVQKWATNSLFPSLLKNFLSLSIFSFFLDKSSYLCLCKKLLLEDVCEALRMIYLTSIYIHIMFGKSSTIKRYGKRIRKQRHAIHNCSVGKRKYATLTFP